MTSLTTNQTRDTDERELLITEYVPTEGGGIAIVTLNRPDHRNPLDAATVEAFHAMLDQLDADPDVRAIVVTGAGPAFSAGGDMRGYRRLYYDAELFRVFIDDVAGLFKRFEQGPKLSVAMVNGACVAGGFELAMACDLVTIGETAKIGDAHIRFAQLPGAGGGQRLVRAVGSKRAGRLLLTGDTVTGPEAVELGLASDCFADHELRERTIEIVKRVLKHSPLTLQRMRDLVLLGQNRSLFDSLAEETEIVFRYATESYDAKEGVEAFLEKRPAAYRGE